MNELLRKYMAFIRQEEGTTFLDRVNEGEIRFTTDEYIELMNTEDSLP